MPRSDRISRRSPQVAHRGRQRYISELCISQRFDRRTSPRVLVFTNQRPASVFVLAFVYSCASLAIGLRTPSTDQSHPAHVFPPDICVYLYILPCLSLSVSLPLSRTAVNMQMTCLGWPTSASTYCSWGRTSIQTKPGKPSLLVGFHVLWVICVQQKKNSTRV